ncbi:MAG: type II toxin-antitoxin system death-on-curing family toxin [Actinomycetota bacterium]|nr:type II toxin-antitoxin system death-on-curing family toxin [Actinomycetota bacterium]
MEINNRLVGTGIRDKTVLSSAVAAPELVVFGHEQYSDVHSKAGALMWKLNSNHPFVDGNKRTALVATDAFYHANGWELGGSQKERAALSLGIAKGQLSVQQTTAKLKSLARRSQALRQEKPSRTKEQQPTSQRLPVGHIDHKALRERQAKQAQVQKNVNKPRI